MLNFENMAKPKSHKTLYAGMRSLTTLKGMGIKEGILSPWSCDVQFAKWYNIPSKGQIFIKKRS